MVRKSRREIETDLEQFDESTDEIKNRLLVWEQPETGGWYNDPELTEGPLNKDRTNPVMVVETEHYDGGP
jgi:hypothetical protein